MKPNHGCTCHFSALAGRQDGNVIYLKRRVVNNPNSAVQSESVVWSKSRVLAQNSTYGDNPETPVNYGHQAVTTWRFSFKFIPIKSSVAKG